MQRAFSASVRFTRSANPFCSGVFAEVFVCSILFAAYSSKSESTLASSPEVYSPPPSVRNDLTSNRWRRVHDRNSLNLSFVCDDSTCTGGYTQNGTFSEFCILSRHLDRFCSSKRPRGPRGPPELPNDKKTAAPRLLDRLLFRYPPPQIRLKWDVLSVTFNGKFQR